MDSRTHAAAVALVLLAATTAGCAGLVGEVGEVGPDGVPAVGPLGSGSGPDNPWGQSVVPVVVNDTLGTPQNETALVERAIDYWTANRDRYTNWSYRFRLTDDPAAARVEVRIVGRIDECNGPSTNTAGCAPLLDRGDRAGETEVVRIAGDRSNAAVTTTTKHEFGHLLGLDHGEEPRWLMANGSQGPVRDAGDRPNPWMTDEITVGLDPTGLSGDSDAIREQVRHAVAYYDRGANGTVPVNVTFRRTDLVTGADVLVTNDPGRGCAIDGGSSGSFRGSDRDGDRALETHTGATVCVDVDVDALGWHVGYWLGRSMGDEGDDLAAPFRDAGYEQRRSNWWE